MHFDKVASGHYAQVRENNNLFELVMAPDAVKDQTYFLSYLSQEQLSKLLFPIGHLDKNQVRELAQQYNLANKERKDSQGICFLGKLKFPDFIKHYLGEKNGELVEYETGKQLGTHKGFWYHTLGQRQGLGLAGGPWYVVKKDPDENRIYISRDYYNEEKQRNSFYVSECNWMSGSEPVRADLHVKLRHGQHRYACHMTREGQQFFVQLDSRDQGLAPGQFAVFYDGDVCLGSGIIQS